MEIRKTPFEELEKQWEPLIYKFAQKHTLPNVDVEDVAQELRLVLSKAQDKYDEKRDCKFDTYLYRAFDNTCKLMYRNSQGFKKHIPANQIIHIGSNFTEENQPSFEDDEIKHIDLLVGLGAEANKLGGLIIGGMGTRDKWLSAGMTKEQIKKAKKELKQALIGGRK